MSGSFAWPWQLRRLGVLGMNARNALYIGPNNPRHLYPRVDDKLISKQLAIDAGIAVPELYGVIATQYEARRIDQIVAGHDDFVIKPARGAGGEGIVVITGRIGDAYRKASGVPLSTDDLRHHISNILSGMYSLGGQPDRAMVEYRVSPHPIFDAIAYHGVPDVRVIVYKGFPVLAMLRLPTRMSDGKANLHQGAIGAGIDIASGQTTHGVWRNAGVTLHPDTLCPIAGVQVPDWETVLSLSARAYELTELGYLGADIVIDRQRGALTLELNARPGLSIQIANRIGLRARLQTVDREAPTGAGAAERIAFAQQRFGVAIPTPTQTPAQAPAPTP
ncbi:alpha-L-glutamate ligase-like protein [Sinimarinibacterium sp. NLF-5-8]|uniref:alpha-L-glutamate ligase-like protein n=1 Tax=Sinimarinibacterium sp. NLF-5-8 TaxID=2698684 RepID=UPI00137BFCAF|nr:alpha-L-glutamate ligase-like protein [Sinimarinibacterium sp. NLF-5-8]QHS10558.1 alpha-L-glutamate ligase-like protein [Sinimarinibacterium sp. NLF-5-8]